MAAAKKKTKKASADDADLLDFFNDGADEVRDIFPTGIELVDKPLGGGIPAGVMVEAYGPSMSGKTSIAYSVIGQIQKKGLGRTVLFDVEDSFNDDMGERCGIDKYHVDGEGQRTFNHSNSAEIRVIETLFARIKQILYTWPDVRFIVVDSVAGLVPEAMTEKGANIERTGMLKAKRLADLLPELSRWLADTGNNASVYFVNHEKTVIAMGGHGPPKTTTPGGVSLKFFASMRLEFRIAKTDKLDEYDPVTKQTTKKVDKLFVRVQATKNRFAPPYRPATFIFELGEGIDQISSVLAHASAQGKLAEGGAGWATVDAAYTADGEPKKLQGLKKFKAYYLENPEAYEKLKAAVVRDLGTTGTTTEVDDTTPSSITKITDLDD
jgi:recombination protein RecA